MGTNSLSLAEWKKHMAKQINQLAKQHARILNREYFFHKIHAKKTRHGTEIQAQHERLMRAHNRLHRAHRDASGNRRYRNREIQEATDALAREEARAKELENLHAHNLRGFPAGAHGMHPEADMTDPVTLDNLGHKHAHYIASNVMKNGKVRTVYSHDTLMRLLRGGTATSPITSRPFTMHDVRSFPSKKERKRIAHMSLNASTLKTGLAHRKNVFFDAHNDTVTTPATSHSQSR